MSGLLVCPTRGKNSVFTFVMGNAMETIQLLFWEIVDTQAVFLCVLFFFHFWFPFFPPKMVENSLYLYAEGNELRSVEVGEVGSSSIDSALSRSEDWPL